MKGKIEKFETEVKVKKIEERKGKGESRKDKRKKENRFSV
jgi:hypothetical protein